MVQNLNASLGKDRNGDKFSELPITKGKTIDNVGLVIEVTYAETLPAWVSFLGQPRHVPIIYCPTAVMVADGYNYVDSKQIAGMLPGLVGAAQYDVLLNHKGFSKRGADALSWAHVLIIVLIILGNIGYIVSRRPTGQA
jgi:hypothetical protein